MDDLTHRARRRDALIVDALSVVFDMLREVPAGARARELGAQAKSYDQAVKHWTTVPPSETQLEAMFDLVTELHAKVAAIGSSRRTKSWGGQ